jgi:stress-induced morphogen
VSLSIDALLFRSRYDGQKMNFPTSPGSCELKTGGLPSFSGKSKGEHSMGKKDVLEILRKFRKALEERKVHVERMILFGSWAKGTQQEGSDIDVVVVSRDFQGKDQWNRIKMIGGAVYKVFAPIQAATVTPEEWDSKAMTICELAKDGEVVTV